MATFEHRTNAKGRVTAIRAKVRRAGRPHLSRTFAISARGHPDPETAEAAARAWVATLESAMDGQEPDGAGALQSEWRRSMRRGSHVGPGPALPAWLPPSAPDEATLQAALRGLATPLQRGLLRVVLETALVPEALATLRWQHVDLAAQRIALHTPSGLLRCHLTLTSSAAAALLELGTRKYGPVFPVSAVDAHEVLQQAAHAAGIDVAGFYRAAVLRLSSHGLHAREIASAMGLSDLTPLRAAAPPPRAGRALPR